MTFKDVIQLDYVLYKIIRSITTIVMSSDHSFTDYALSRRCFDMESVLMPAEYLHLASALCELCGQGLPPRVLYNVTD